MAKISTCAIALISPQVQRQYYPTLDAQCVDDMDKLSEKNIRLNSKLKLGVFLSKKAEISAS
jgi:hypothetical protein